MRQESQKKYCPEWFNLDNYKLCKQFTGLSWRKAIKDRQLFLVNSSKKITDFYKISSKEYFQSLINIKYDSFFNEPIVKQFDFDEYYQVIEDSINEAETLCSNTEFLISGYGGEYLKRHNPTDFRSLQFEYIKNDMDYPFIENKKEIISIDLDASDNDILENFRKWLFSKRAELKEDNTRIKQLSDNELQKLTDFNVLAYIDLDLWNNQYITTKIGRKLTQAQISNLLYSNEADIDITARLRLTTKPKAKEIMESDLSIF